MGQAVWYARRHASIATSFLGSQDCGSRTMPAGALQAVNRVTAQRVLWSAALLLLPVPYLILVDGSVPVVRLVLLATIAASYAAFVDGSGVAWLMVALLAVQAVVFAVALAVVVRTTVRWIPAPALRWSVWSLVAVGFAVAMLFDVYQTPFDETYYRTNWWGLFQ